MYQRETVGEFIIVSNEEEVNEWIYAASYPAWFLSESRFLERITPSYDLVAEFPTLDGILPEGGEADYKRFVFDLKE